MPRRLALLVLMSCLFAVPSAAAQTATPAPPTPPTQPESGPGGATYAYDEVVARHYGPEPDGTIYPTGYWLFEPAEPNEMAAPASVPLVIFLHGYFATNPKQYQAWIDHIVRRGAVVVYPDYQPKGLDLMDMRTETDRPTFPHALAAIRAAVAELAAGDRVAIDPSKVAVVGHSWGAVLAARYAAVAEAEGLPVPSAVMPVMPGCSCPFPEQVDTVPAATRVIVVVGEEDTSVGEGAARRMWSAMTAVPLDRRDYIRLVGDRHGYPHLRADHFVPATDGYWGPLDAYDWYGTWKFFDLLTECSFVETGCDAALGNTPEQRFMGIWSDGVPVTEAEITDDPAAA